MVHSNAVGKLAELTRKIKDAGVNIYSLVAWVEEDTGHLLLVTDDNNKACSAMSDAVDTCEEDEAVYLKLPHEPGTLHGVAKTLSDKGIDIHMIYATTAEPGQAGVILSTSNNLQAAKLL